MFRLLTCALTAVGVHARNCTPSILRPEVDLAIDISEIVINAGSRNRVTY